jgi:glycosyltransferase involved in cell wall biosynthesis
MRSDKKDKSLAIIVPTYNDIHHLELLLADIIKLLIPYETVVVDDGSTNEVGDIARHADVLHHPYNLGSGAAIKTGIRAAKGDVLVFMDADGQHDPADISKLLEHIEKYDLVVGARTPTQHASWGRRVMNAIYNRLASYVTGFKVEDLTSGFRAIRAERARELLPLLPNRYSWPTTMTLVLLRSGFSVKYVPINLRPRQHGKSGIQPVRDGARFFMIILKICTLYSPMRIFLPVSGALFLAGLINYAHTYFTAGRFTNMSALMFSTAVIVFMLGLISEQISQISLLRQQVGGDEERRDDVKEPSKPNASE